MGGLALKWFIGGGWKQLLGAAVVGSLIVGFAFLYGAWQIEKGMATKYKAERDAARTLSETYQSHLNVCVSANLAWEVMSVGWNERVDELTASSEAFRASLSRERARRRAAERDRDAALAEAGSAITAADCEGALNQLIESLGWGGVQ